MLLCTLIIKKTIKISMHVGCNDNGEECLHYEKVSILYIPNMNQRLLLLIMCFIDVVSTSLIPARNGTVMLMFGPSV